MKKNLLLFLLFMGVLSAHAQWKPFRFAFISDTHVSSAIGTPEEDLRRMVAEIEKDGLVFFRTKNGKVYAIDSRTQKRMWTAKIDNSMINTVNLTGAKQVLASTMDGKVSLLEIK